VARHTARTRRGRSSLPITFGAALIAVAAIGGAVLLISLAREAPRPGVAGAIIPRTEPAAAAAPAAGSGAPPTVKLGDVAVASRAGAPLEIAGTVLLPAGSHTPEVTLVIEGAPRGLEGVSTSWRAMRTRALSVDGTRASFVVTVTPSDAGGWYFKGRAKTDAGEGVSAARYVNVVGPKVVALTFDDGPSATTTPRVLQSLDAAGIHATFFLSGRLANRHPKLARRLIAEGEVVGCHGATHTLLTPLTGAALTTEVAGCRDTLERVTGVRPVWFRPPLGGTNAAVRQAIADAGMRQVLWSVDPRDWETRNTQKIVEAVLSHVRDGSIVLMHDSGGQQGSTDNAVPILIRELTARGYDFVTLDERAALGYPVR
jgi:peptidoglycan-N-acetylglucosamine deacetylase